MSEQPQRFIVAEVSCSYDSYEDQDVKEMRMLGKLGTIAKRFEHVIDVNTARGYRLYDWQFQSTTTHVSVGSVTASRITETIVAVFEFVGDVEASETKS